MVLPLRDLNPTHQPALVVRTLVVLNVLVWLYELSDPERIILAFGFTPKEFWASPFSEWPTLFTSMFLHGSWSHIIGNMWFLWVFGDNIEERLGHLRFLLFYLAGGLAAAMAQGLLAMGDDMPMVGASGAIAAVLGAYYVLYPHIPIYTLIFLFWPFFYTLTAGFYLGYWVLINVVQGLVGAAGNVAVWAHVGGFVLGIVIARSFLPPRNQYG